MKYVIWATSPKPHTGHPLDRPGIAQGVCAKDHYETAGLPFLEGEPTTVLEEFEAETEGEAQAFFDAWDDAKHEAEGECPICKKDGCGACLDILSSLLRSSADRSQK